MNLKKKALGRGLSALLDSSETDLSEEGLGKVSVAGSVANIAIENIESNPNQPRKIFDEGALKELSLSILKQGIIQPVTVRKQSGKYQLISGERRLKASIMAGLVEIPAYIRVVEDNEILEMALVENIQREDLNAIEISLTYQQLIEECKFTQEQLSDRVGKNRSTITNYLRLLKLPAEIQIGIRSEKITMGHARALITINDINTQLSIFHKIIEEGLSVRQVEEMSRKAAALGKTTVNIKPINTLPNKYQKIKDNIGKITGVNANLKRSANGRGQIIIPFVSDEELEKILDRLSIK